MPRILPILIRWASVIALVLLGSTPALTAQPVTVDLVLCLDSSGSMGRLVGAGTTRWEIERDGAASAVADPMVIPQDGSVRVTVIQFSTTAQVEVPPTRITPATAPQVAAQIQAIQPFFDDTHIGSCIDAAVAQLAPLSPVADKRVIDVSTDGLPNQPEGQGPQAAVAAADAAIAAGVDAVNALGIILDARGTAFLESMVRPQPAGGPDGFVVSVDDIAEYRDRLAEKIVREIASCLSIAEDGLEVLCPGDGGDRFTLSLTFTNQSAAEVHNLFVLEDPSHPLPPGVVILDDYFDFSSDPICSPAEDPACRPADATRTVQITVRGAPGASFQLLVTAHDADHTACCERPVPVELPACDCAQVLGGTATCQVTPGGTRWKYDFSFQNLTDQTVEHLLLTPISPAGIDLDPNHFLSLGLAPVSPAGGGTTTRTTFISGPGAAPGAEVCFYLSSHTSGFDACCAIQQCVTLPSCIIDPVVSFDPLGSSQVFFRDSKLVVTDIGNSGRGGIRFTVPPAESFRAEWEPLAPTASSYFLQVAGRGTVNGRPNRPVATVRAFDTEAGMRVEPTTFVGALRTVEVRRNGSTVGTFDLASGQGVTLPGRQPCKGVSLAREGVNTIVIWPQAVSLVPDGAAEAIEGDEIVFHVAQRAEVAGLTRVNVRARAIPEIVFTEVRSAPVGVEEPEP